MHSIPTQSFSAVTIIAGTRKRFPNLRFGKGSSFQRLTVLQAAGIFLGQILTSKIAGEEKIKNLHEEDEKEDDMVVAGSVVPVPDLPPPENGDLEGVVCRRPAVARL